MSKKITLELTEYQFIALIRTIDSASSILDEDITTTKDIKTFDRMLLKNGYKRIFN